MFGEDRKVLNIRKEEENFWPTFTDLLSVIVLVFLLLLFAYFIVAHNTTIESQEMQTEINNVMEEIIGFRKSIAEDLRKELSNSNLLINVDETTGAITFSGDVLFNVDSAEIRPEFREMLKKFIPPYVKIILDKKNRDNISQIIIEGHTDDDGSYMYNLDLSQRRAFSVVKYILSDEFPDYKYKEELKQYITANGKSKSTLKFNDDGTVNKEKSRRVEFKFNIKDEILINKMKEIIK